MAASNSNSEWSKIENIHERRKAQNRIAQRNYRARQKLRLRFAEAVLLDIPGLGSSFQELVGQTRNEHGGNGTLSFIKSNPVIPAGYETQQQGRTSSINGKETPKFSGLGGRSTGGEAETSGNMDACAVPVDHTFNGDSELELFTEKISNTACMDSPPGHTGWMEIVQPLDLATSSPPTPSHTASTNGKCLTGSHGTSSMAASPPSPKEICDSPPIVSLGGAFSPPVEAAASGTSAGFPIPRTAMSLMLSPSRLTLSTPKTTTSTTTTAAATTTTGTSRSDAATLLCVEDCADGMVPSKESPSEPISPLLTAASMGNLQIAQLLVQSGAKIDIADGKGRTALHMAVERGDTAMAHTMLDLGADILTKDAAGSGLLHTAVHKDNRDMVRALLKWCLAKDAACHPDAPADADAQNHGPSLLRVFVNAHDAHNRTPLLLCVLMQRVEMVEILLSHGADANNQLG